MSESYDRQTSTPNETDTLREILRTEHLHRRTANVGTVVSFDRDCQTATIQVGIEMDLNGSIQPIAPLLDVPVLFPRVGARGITWLLEAGDDGLIVFCDRAIGRWLDEGSTVYPEDTRIKHLSDAIFIPGIKRNCGDAFDGLQISGADGQEINIGSSCFDIKSNGCSLMDTLIEFAGSTNPPNLVAAAALKKIKGLGC